MYLFELQQIANKHIDCERIYIVPCDMLPNKFKPPAGFIINLSTSKQKGTHWVALAIDANRRGKGQVDINQKFTFINFIFV